VKRRLDGAAALILALLAASPAHAQTPLLAGSVRDQHGAPIAGALVTARAPASVRAAATTDAGGTFVLHADGIARIRVTCRYCQSVELAVHGSEPVVAILWRYDALANDSPSAEDLASLPYAHVESSVALRPFTLLSQSSAPYPGSVLADRGLSTTGSLLIDNGAPNYDIVAGGSPYGSIPAQYEQNAVVRDASNAFSYGDQAAGGIVALDPFLGGSSAEIAEGGSDVIARAQAGSDLAAVALGTFSNNEESRQRGDATANLPLTADESLVVAGGSEEGREYGSPDSTFAQSFSFADAAWSVPRALNLTVSGVVDRGDYAYTQDEYPISTQWSDSGLSAGIHSDGPIVAFADAGIRSSTGIYDAQALPGTFPRLAASLQQTRADAGVVTSGNDYSLVAGVGAFWFDYAGGVRGFSQPARTALAVPSLQSQLFPNGKFSLNLQESGSFTLPTFEQQYLFSDWESLPVQLTRNWLQAAALSYTDGARIRFAFEEATQNVSGASSGKISSSGVSAIWQIAPAISLRAWTMHVTDEVPLYGIELPYAGGAPTVSAVWLTYDTGNAVRADAIYRRDLLDGLPFYHVDGAISGPIVDRLRWYAGAEDRLRRRFVDVGLRFSGS